MPSSWGDIDLDDETSDLDGDLRSLFDVNILERHPFTTQTFIPMGIGAAEQTQYLVIVAPTLPASAARRKGDTHPPYPTPTRRKRRSVRDIFARARPSPFTNEAAPPASTYSRLHASQRPKGPGLPDLKNIRAFVANGRQAVTYGAGTWHAPMVVVGKVAVDFVVVQFVNGVGNEDCQEVELVADERADEGATVAVDTDGRGRVVVKAGVGAVRAKL
jgi:ureidoglycolate lyase